MVDTLLKGVILGVAIYVWYYVGTAVPWINEHDFMVTHGTYTYAIPGLGYLFFTFLAFALARGGK